MEFPPPGGWFNREKTPKEEEELQQSEEERRIQDVIGLAEWDKQVTAEQTAQEKEQLQQEKGLLEEQAGIDHLTGAKNRKVFDHELERSLEKARTGERRGKGNGANEVALVFVDFDHFKKINDTYGHPVGDEVLKKASAVLMSSVRKEDIVARYGGEEFVVLFRGASKDFAKEAAENFREEISKLTFSGAPELKVTASFGVASSESTTDATVLLRQADEALYAAKHAGRDRVEVYQGA